MSKGQPRRPANKIAPLKRLRGLDEFVRPHFVGRMGRVERRRRWAWHALLAGAVGVGVASGLVLF